MQVKGKPITSDVESNASSVVRNDESREFPTRDFLKFSISSLACASLANRMWITANQLFEDPSARDQVFRAGQRLFGLIEEQRDTAINNFVKANQVGAVVLGVISAVTAIKAITIAWNHRDRWLSWLR